jgi:acetyltransferase-like isoleucine patch superfamily enzyme
MASAASLYAKSAICTLWFRARGVQCSIVTCEGSLPVLHSAGSVTIHGRLAVRGKVARSELGANEGGRLEIGDGGFINHGASLVAELAITVGEHVRIGDFAAIYDSDYHPVDESHAASRAPVTIGDNVWLGRGAIVLPGSTIGDHAVVAAGAVVRGGVPASVLVAGNPAKVVRELQASDGWRRD